MVIILAQLFKADFEKGWAAWLQAMVTTTIGLGAVWVTWDYMTDEDEVLARTMVTCVPVCETYLCVSESNILCLAPAEIMSVGEAIC